MEFFLGDSKEQIYWEEVMKAYLPKSKAAMYAFKNLQPFQHGEEQQWQEELEQVEQFIYLLKENKNLKNELELLFSNFHDITLILEKVKHERFDDIDPLTDGYQIKQFLWFSYRISEKILSFQLEKGFQEYDWYQTANQPWVHWIKLFHPNNSNLYPQFALQDIDHEQLKKMRAEKRGLLKERRRLERELVEQIKEAYGLSFNQNQYLFVPQDFDQLEKILIDPRLIKVNKQYEGYFLKLASSEPLTKIEHQLEEIEKLIKHEEKNRFQQLFDTLGNDLNRWIDAHHSWVVLEILFKKAEMALDMNGVKPVLEVDIDKTIIKNGIHPYISKQWGAKGMTPLSLTIKQGVTVIYGANMSGKTIALRTVGFLQGLAQFGFFVPAELFHFRFVSHISLMTGDYQDINENLSSFGAEVKRLNNDLLYIDERILLLLDETGKGTNPLEGEALTISIIQYLKKHKNVQCLLVTHFPKAIQVEGIDLYEANHHQLSKADKGHMVYKAIDIAEELGLLKEIVSQAKVFLLAKSKDE